MPSSTPAEPVVEEDRVCPECGSEHLVRDYARGELVCDSCGLVISEGAIDEGPEWSAYSVEENDRLARTGAPRSYVAGASGLTTVIPLANRDARGNTIPLREREKFYRMRKLQRHSGHSRPGERSLPETIRSLDRVASLMGLPRPVKDEAGFICKKALERGLVRGRSIEAIVAAADYVSRFCSRLGLSNTVEAESHKILKELEKIESSMSLSPAGTAAAAIYLASLACGERRPQKAIAKIAGVSEVTLRNRFQFMEGFMQQLVLPRGRAPKLSGSTGPAD